jgi:transposase-like protein
MRHTIEETLRIVEEGRAKGASVAMVARRHNVNANQAFAGRVARRETRS